ncbi:hypothetical protein BG004_004600 [Podila humilis]|nr:hypothetical protein BG004_004600 [Podila humilis]
MATYDYPLESILARSVNDGVNYTNDRSSDSTTRMAKLKSISLRTPSESPHLGRAIAPTMPPPRKNNLNTINGARKKYSTLQTNGYYVIDHQHVQYTEVSGYGLGDDTSSEEDEEEEEDNSFEDDFKKKDELGDNENKDNDWGGVVILPSAVSSGHRNKPRPNNSVEYVAHVTGRLDPWELQMQKLREESKELAPQIANRITNDFQVLKNQLKTQQHQQPQQQQSSNTATARDYNDITQRLKDLTTGTEEIKENRRKETEAMNQALSRDIESCLEQIKVERETAIRIREEALHRARLEEERLAKEAEDQKRAAEAEKEAKEKRAKEASEAAAAASAAQAKKLADEATKRASLASANAAGMFASESANLEHQHYKSVLAHIHDEVVVTVQNNKALKQFCGEAKREIIPLIGQLINVREEIVRVAITIDGVFKRVKEAQGDLGYYWIMNIAAKKFVQQAGNDLLVKADPAFPMAHVIVLLFTNHPKFLDVIMARFAKKCPYILPVYIAHDSADTTDQFMKKLGYAKKEKGWETEAQYDARQCAIFSLYCAIMQTDPPVGRNLYPIEHAWTWMARILNMPPRPITPALISSFIDAMKVLRLMVEEFIPLIPKEGVAGATRLKTQLEDLMKTGRIPVPNGRNFSR